MEVQSGEWGVVILSGVQHSLGKRSTVLQGRNTVSFLPIKAQRFVQEYVTEKLDRVLAPYHNVLAASTPLVGCVSAQLTQLRSITTSASSYIPSVA